MIHVVHAYFRYNDRAFYTGETLSERELAERGLEGDELALRVKGGFLFVTTDPEPDPAGATDPMGEAVAAAIDEAVRESDEGLAEAGADQTMTGKRRRSPKE